MPPELQAPFAAPDAPPEFSRETRSLSYFVGRLLHEANDAPLALKALALSIASDRTATVDQISFVAGHITRHAVDLAHAGQLQQAGATHRLGELLAQRAREMLQKPATPVSDPRLGRMDH